MSTIPTPLLSLIIATSFSFAACSKDEAKTDPDPKPTPTAEVKPETKTAPETKPTEAAIDDKSFAAGMMSSYEECRALLAADKTEGIADCANGIVAASKTAQADAPEAATAHIGTVVKAAEALASAKADDIEAVRLSFGGVSESVVAMLTAAPSAAKSYHVFECPMAKGYKRWAQPGATLENPYMGAKMLSCGMEVHDHHKGMGEDEHKGDGSGKGGGKGKGK